MEKFGIFELLDALSAITAATSGEKAPSSPAPSRAEEKTETKRTPDAAFAPPSYADGGGTDGLAPSGRTAYDGFVARHEAAKGRVKK